MSSFCWIINFSTYLSDFDVYNEKYKQQLDIVGDQILKWKFLTLSFMLLDK